LPCPNFLLVNVCLDDWLNVVWWWGCTAVLVFLMLNVCSSCMIIGRTWSWAWSHTVVPKPSKFLEENHMNCVAYLLFDCHVNIVKCYVDCVMVGICFDVEKPCCQTLKCMWAQNLATRLIAVICKPCCCPYQA
jgi:hypothetical protein